MIGQPVVSVSDTGTDARNSTSYSSETVMGSVNLPLM